MIKVMRNRTLDNIQAFRELLEILAGSEVPRLDLRNIRPAGTPIGPARAIHNEVITVINAERE